MKPSLEEVEALVIECIQGRASFQNALNAVVRYQHAWNTPLRDYWARRGFRPEDGLDVSADQIPGVPTDVFRHVKLVSSERAPSRVFRTSGTTSGARGEAHRISTAAYDQGATHFFTSFFGRPLCAPNTHVPALVFDPVHVPDSSLSHMVHELGEAAGGRVSYHMHPTTGLDLEGLCAQLDAHDGSPFTLFGTAFALVHLFDALAAALSKDPAAAARVRLPQGSIVVETGGYKGRSRTLEKPELYREIARTFGIPIEDVRSEYSMTELSSQLYSKPWDAQGDQILVPPHWCRVSAVHPETLAPLPSGEPGLLRFLDLANVDTVVAIQTSDIGTVQPTGKVILQGRSPGAVPRGCSLAIEEVLATAAHRRRDPSPSSEERST